MVKSTFKYVTYIRTTPGKLWQALTNTDIIKQYWFGMRAESNWQVGSTWKFYYDANPMDSGEILESVPEKRLVLNWLNEWKPELKAEGNSRCVYEMEQFGRSVMLKITHSSEQPNSKLIEAVSEGWPMCISNLKSLLETGEVALTEHPGHEE
jgi:uncharacterized protein YndB with AHSA1/START domain